MQPIATHLIINNYGKICKIISGYPKCGLPAFLRPDIENGLSSDNELLHQVNLIKIALVLLEPTFHMIGCIGPKNH